MKLGLLLAALAACVRVLLGNDEPFYAPQHVIMNPMYTSWGRFGDWDVCPPGTYAKGISGKWDRHVDSDDYDDTALNSLSLYCGSIGELRDMAQVPERTITSREGPFGDAESDVYWCPGDGFITGFSARIEGSQGKGDDTAMNQVKVFCSSGDTLGGPSTGVGGTTWGDWWKGRRCPAGSIVGALVTQVEGNQGSGDDTAMNNVQMDCVPLAIPCVPKDSYEEVLRCKNGKSTPISCSFDQTVGMEMMVSDSSGKRKAQSFSASLGISLGGIVSKIIGAKISASGSWSSNTSYSWSKTKSTWDRQTTTRHVDTQNIRPGYTGIVLQVHASCGDPFAVWAPSFEVLEIANDKLAAAEAALKPADFHRFLLSHLPKGAQGKA